MIVTLRRDGELQVAEVRDGPESPVLFESLPQPDPRRATEEAEGWMRWSAALPEADTVYYFLEVPETWAGPPPGAHPWSGLRMKIGRTNNVVKRLLNLQTGSSARLIMVALEPGGAKLERDRHRQFGSDRRQGEWFACSPALAQHAIDTWSRYRMLHPDHQREMLRLIERIEILKGVRKLFNGPPAMINPSLNESWEGSWFVDLVHAFRPEER